MSKKCSCERAAYDLVMNACGKCGGKCEDPNAKPSELETLRAQVATLTAEKNSLNSSVQAYSALVARNDELAAAEYARLNAEVSKAQAACVAMREALLDECVTTLEAIFKAGLLEHAFDCLCSGNNVSSAGCDCGRDALPWKEASDLLTRLKARGPSR